jgi:hypothetical protein
MKTFSEYINEAMKKNRIEKVIVKGLERYIVQGSENGKPYVITSSGEKRIGKEYFKELGDEDYFKSEKDAKKYINEARNKAAFIQVVDGYGNGADEV